MRGRALAKKIHQYFFKQHPFFWIFVFVLVLNGVFLAAHPTLALNDILGYVVEMVGWLLYGITTLLGKLTVALVGLILTVGNYNNFINEKAIVAGWTVIRDVANMFFIIVMLVIAFSTVMRIESYSYRSLLFRTLLMAILVNFSRHITGLLIDFAQVFMLTFFNAYNDAAVGNFTQALGMDKIFRFNPDDLTNTGALDILMALILGMIFTAISLVVILIILLTLLQRIIWLWFLVVLSPLPYIQQAVPFLRGNLGFDWWSSFTRYVTIGPLLAFFLWMTLYSLQVTQTDPTQMLINATTENTLTETVLAQGATPPAPAPTPGGASPSSISIAPTEVGRLDFILSYAIAIGMLVTSLMVTSKLGGVAGQWAGKAAGGLKDLGKKVSGIQAAGDVAGVIKSNWESKRKDRAQKRASALTRGVGAVGTAPGRLLKFLTKPITGRAQRGKQAALSRAMDFRRQAAAPGTSMKRRARLLAQAKGIEAAIKTASVGGRVFVAGATGGASELVRAVHGGFEKVGQIGQNLMRDSVYSTKDKLKSETDAKILSNINDPSLDAATRMASILAAAERNLVDKDDIDPMMATIKRLGGGDPIQRAFLNSVKDRFPTAALRARGQLGEQDYQSIGRDIKVGKLDVEKIDAEMFSSDEGGQNLAFTVAQNASGKKVDSMMEDADKRNNYRDATGAWITAGNRAIDPTRPQDYLARQKMATHHLLAGGSIDTALAHEGSADDGTDHLKAESSQMLKDIMGSAGGMKLALGIDNKEISGTSDISKETLEGIVTSMQYSDFSFLLREAKTKNQRANLKTYVESARDLGSAATGTPAMQALLKQIRANPELSLYLK